MRAFLFLALISTLHTSAQNSFGFHLGIASTYISNVGNNNATEPIIGLTSTFPLKKRWTIKTGILFERKSSKLIMDQALMSPNNSISSQSAAVEYLIQYHFLTIPILFEFAPKIKNRTHFLGGPFASYKSENSDTHSIKHQPFDIGICFGAGYRIPTKKAKSLVIQLTISRGLSPIAWSVNEQNSSIYNRQYTNSANLSLTYEFIRKSPTSANPLK